MQIYNVYCKSTQSNHKTYFTDVYGNKVQYSKNSAASQVRIMQENPSKHVTWGYERESI